ncbi:MAG TPA: error-prone DNA polymerase [Acetobacteraceae bacterium]|nr:error-prone DNA polymerase [Acetobacteraceae bacterium]
MSYAELQAASAFSFLRGASSPEELAATASVLGLSAIGITDLNSVAGVVRMWDAAKEIGIRLVVGARLSFRDDTPDLLCYPRDRAAWGRLTRLLTIGKGRVPHGDTGDAAKTTNRCFLHYADLLEHGEGQLLLAVVPNRLDAGFQASLQRLRADFRGRAYLAASRRYRGDDASRLRAMAELPLPMVATNDVLCHLPDRRPLQDVMTCIRLGCRIDQAGLALQPNAERHLKSPKEMERLFRDYPDAVMRTEDIVERCGFSLEELAYEYPDEPIPPGLTPDEHLANLTRQGAAVRYPAGIPPQVRDTIEKELRIIAQLNYARYFLTVHDIVRYAVSRNILCQGRGSAANSAVCYCLHITAVDPAQINLLFERFISSERREPPDIDVDFEHERREEVIQYIYERYGRERAGIAATVIHYRPKRAIREVGKVMGLSEDATAALSAQSWHAGEELWSDECLTEIGLDPASFVVRRSIELARQLVGLPRHLSQHVGGFVLTRGRLDETVPIGRAAMDKRTFIEWDKDDIDRLGIMKVDVLALGMLTCIRKAFELLGIGNLAEVPTEDPAVYDMLCRGDSIGVFQVESRAQINMLPRLRPRTFYDLVIEVAIVRPGPIQGDMVHPYLRRRQGLERPDLPSPAPDCGSADELQQVLGRTLGVPLFQEQAMRIAIDAAKFTPEEANQLRRSMATFRNAGTIHRFFAKMVEGMTARGYTQDFAERCFHQIEGFGTYGFPESHAASFALLVYVSAWLKCHHPAAFASALLNSQPMGFYAPAQIVRDAREQGVEVRAIDVDASEWDCTLEEGALRLGFRLISGFSQAWAERLVAARSEMLSLPLWEGVWGRGQFGTGNTPSPQPPPTRGGRVLSSFPELIRTGLPRAALVLLAEADALRSLKLDRRAALWQVRGLSDMAELPLFAHQPVAIHHVPLPVMTKGEHVITDYQTAGLSLKSHPMRFLRSLFSSEGVLSCAQAAVLADGARLSVAGVVLVRQRPGNGNVVFCTIEDETGIANIVVWSSLLDRFRRAILGSSLLQVTGRLQRSPEGIIHVIADRLDDRSAMMARIADVSAAGEKPSLRSPGHPRQERIIPRSRDFH